MTDTHSSQFYCRSEVDSCLLCLLFSVKNFSPTSVLAEARWKQLNSCSSNLNFSFLICKKTVVYTKPQSYLFIVKQLFFFSIQFNFFASIIFNVMYR